MPNHFFRFKQFNINQDKCAMKVCTDACLFGAWLSNHIQQKNIQINKVLDIGTGTGLLSLIMAQHLQASFDAIEIDELAASQAKENFEASPWAAQFNVINEDLKKWKSVTKYDLIISNPPFFENDLRSYDNARNLALHHDGLRLEILLEIVKNKLRDNGNFAVLIPYKRREYFLSLIQKNKFYLEEEVQIKQTEKHNPFRLIFIISKTESVNNKTEIYIKEEGEYSYQFTSLLQNYYLNL